MLKNKLKNLCGLFLSKREKERLYNLCIKYNIPITYPRLFSDNNRYYFWGIRTKGVGLISVAIMHQLKDHNGTIFNSLDELEEYLNLVK